MGWRRAEHDIRLIGLKILLEAGNNSHSSVHHQVLRLIYSVWRSVDRRTQGTLGFATGSFTSCTQRSGHEEFAFPHDLPPAIQRYQLCLAIHGNEYEILCSLLL